MTISEQVQNDYEVCGDHNHLCLFAGGGSYALGIPVFMKEDLLPIMGEAQMVQEFPLAFYRVLEEQKT